MKNCLPAVFILLLVGCALNIPPMVTPEMVAANSGRPITIAQLQHGRTLFASRCIECHTLPALTAHSEAQWPQVVNTMAARASLKPAEREAVLAYILAARTQRTSFH